jgi:[ribosomal protein S18]-alanine N-acetyltransferase
MRMVRLGVSTGKTFNVDFLKFSELMQVLAPQDVPQFEKQAIYNVPVQFTVRDYRTEDFETLWAIDQSCFAPGIAYSRNELLTYICRPGGFTLVAESAESDVPKALGFIVAETSRRGTGHIITIDVRAEARRHRVGSTLLQAAEEKLRTAKSRAVRLETAVDNTSALHFYKRHGYNVIRVIPHYYSSGVDALLLEKDLRSAKTAS